MNDYTLADLVLHLLVLLAIVFAVSYFTACGASCGWHQGAGISEAAGFPRYGL